MGKHSAPSSGCLGYIIGAVVIAGMILGFIFG
jgi:hypothetical protein